MHDTSVGRRVHERAERDSWGRRRDGGRPRAATAVARGWSGLADELWGQRRESAGGLLAPPPRVRVRARTMASRLGDFLHLLRRALRGRVAPRASLGGQLACTFWGPRRPRTAGGSSETGAPHHAAPGQGTPGPDGPPAAGCCDAFAAASVTRPPPRRPRRAPRPRPRARVPDARTWTSPALSPRTIWQVPRRAPGVADLRCRSGDQAPSRSSGRADVTLLWRRLRLVQRHVRACGVLKAVPADRPESRWRRRFLGSADAGAAPADTARGRTEARGGAFASATRATSPRAVEPDSGDAAPRACHANARRPHLPGDARVALARAFAAAASTTSLQPLAPVLRRRRASGPARGRADPAETPARADPTSRALILGRASPFAAAAPASGDHPRGGNAPQLLHASAGTEPPGRPRCCANPVSKPRGLASRAPKSRRRGAHGRRGAGIARAGERGRRCAWTIGMKVAAPAPVGPRPRSRRPDAAAAGWHRRATPLWRATGGRPGGNTSARAGVLSDLAIGRNARRAARLTWWPGYLLQRRRIEKRSSPPEDAHTGGFGLQRWARAG